MRRTALFLFVFTFLTTLVSAQAAPLGAGCDPFNPDGSVKRVSECPCSQDPAEDAYCMDATEYLKESLAQKAGIALLGGARRVAELAWFLDRWAAALADFALNGGIWQQIRDAALDTLRGVVGGSGGVLDLVSRGPNGLMYLALVLAGILLIVPVALYGQQPVKLERVILWGLFMAYLFIRTTQGFDLIGEAENLRVGVMQTILGGQQVSLADLVARPMGATEAETTVISDQAPLTLPAAFESQHFPAFRNSDRWRFRVLVASALNNMISVVFPGELYSDQAMQRHTQAATAGVLRALLSLVAGAVLLLVALALIVLTAAALVLIVFFVAALPLGFFEFGATILGNILRQYLSVFALSLFVAIFLRILGGLGTAVFGTDYSMAGLVTYTGGLGVVLVAELAAISQGWNALGGVFSAVRPLTGATAVSPVFGGTVPGAEQAGELGSAVGTAAMVGAGAATGGTGAAVLAGASALTGGTDTGYTATAALASLAKGESAGKKAFRGAALVAGGLAATAAGAAASRLRRGKEQGGEPPDPKIARTPRVDGMDVSAWEPASESSAAPALLAHMVREPADAQTPLYVGDTPALYKMHDTSQRFGWDEAVLEGVFEHANAVAVLPPEEQEDALYRRLLEDERTRDLNPLYLRDVSSTALLLRDSARVAPDAGAAAPVEDLAADDQVAAGDAVPVEGRAADDQVAAGDQVVTGDAAPVESRVADDQVAAGDQVVTGNAAPVEGRAADDQVAADDQAFTGDAAPIEGQAAGDQASETYTGGPGARPSGVRATPGQVPPGDAAPVEGQAAEETPVPKTTEQVHETSDTPSPSSHSDNPVPPASGGAGGHPHPTSPTRTDPAAAHQAATDPAAAAQDPHPNPHPGLDPHLHHPDANSHGDGAGNHPADPHGDHHPDGDPGTDFS